MAAGVQPGRPQAIDVEARLLEDRRDRAVRIYVETHGRLYDMANSRDWRTLADDGVDNEAETNKTSERCGR